MSIYTALLFQHGYIQNTELALSLAADDAGGSAGANTRPMTPAAGPTPTAATTHGRSGAVPSPRSVRWRCRRSAEPGARSGSGRWIPAPGLETPLTMPMPGSTTTPTAFRWVDSPARTIRAAVPHGRAALTP